MAFSDKLGDKPSARRKVKESHIDRALRTWPEKDSKLLAEALADVHNWTNYDVAAASNGEDPQFSDSAVAKWRRDNGLR